MASISKKLEDLSSKELDNIGSRLTTSRVKILTILENAERPLTITEISDRAKQMAQSSLYRNLTVLEQANLVNKISTDHDFAFFELSEHLLGHHHHLRCINCASVIDVELSAKDEKAIETLSKTIAKKHSYTNIHHHLEFSGLCEKCS